MLAASNLHRFAHEDKARRARHAEIKRRYAWFAGEHRKYPRGSQALLCRVRLHELERLFESRYARNGGFLTNDDAGIDDLTIVAHHIAHIGGDAIVVAWAAQWMPDMPRERAETLTRAVLDDPVKFKAQTLGWRLRLTDEERSALGITTIRPFGVTDADMAERRKAKARERAARWRARQEKKPRKVPPCEIRPWDALGMSRSTWYRKGKPAAPGCETKPRTQQVEVANNMLRTNSVSPSQQAARPVKKAVRASIIRPKPWPTRNIVSLEGEGFRVRPWHPDHIRAQAVGGWWRGRWA